MTKPLENTEREQRIEELFLSRAVQPCLAGTALLRSFALVRPADFAFLKPQDLADLDSSAFAGISEWEAFIAHYASCEQCYA